MHLFRRCLLHHWRAPSDLDDSEELAQTRSTFSLHVVMAESHKQQKKKKKKQKKQKKKEKETNLVDALWVSCSFGATV